ncbi:MAG: hypothetical protein IT359_09720 [Gemmatimonadaceae bacterium]|nr:hypothetical protein [Gemmatimonadaceae bacterium]
MRVSPNPTIATVVTRLALTSLLASGACANSHDGGLGVPAPGEPAAIVLSGVSWAGGHVYREETRLDSATMRYRHRWCQGQEMGADCNLDQHVQTGAAYTVSALEMFRMATSSEFRSLRSQYVLPSGVQSPDPGTGWFDVTVNGYYRRVTWSVGAALPPVISSMSCAMLSVRGSLVLCD